MTLEEIKEEMEKLAILHARGVSYSNYKDVLDKAFRLLYKVLKCLYDIVEKQEEEKVAKISVEVK